MVKKSHLATLLILAALIALIPLLLSSPKSPSTTTSKSKPVPSLAPPEFPASQTSPATAQDPPPSSSQAPKSSAKPPLSPHRDLDNPLAPASFELAPPPRPAESDPDTERDLDQIVLMLRDYRSIAGENPVGTNAEIMQAILGRNPKGAKLGPPQGMALDGEGQLLDRWGTPYFFHQLTKDLMEIQSAGPDRRIGTPDDLILK